MSEDEEEEEESDWETVWRWEVGRIGERAVNVLHAFWEKDPKDGRHRRKDLQDGE